jgi:hypothetical protein
MRIGGFSLFSRTSSRRVFNIASWHNPKSLTWRWLLYVSFTGWNRHVRLGFYRVGNRGQLMGLNLPFVSVSFQTQEPMWFADIEARRRAERAQGLTS